jgi:ArsR family transcriptional regulator, arsenate/arsenite/antimonite-responsive transcriptional repressor
MADIFDVLADATRRDILSALLEAPATTAALSKSLGTDDTAKQLAVLAKAGLVVAEGEGARKTWRLEPTPLAEIDGWLVPFLDAAGSFATDGGASAFAAWSGSDVGETLGRAIADRSHKARVVIEDASEKAKQKLPKTVARKLGRQRPNES